MNVRDLISLLEECDGDAEVRIMSQEGWPFECAVDGIAVREDMLSDACDCDHRITEDHEQGCAAEDEDLLDGCAMSDVFIVEGQQERYGSKRAWAVSRSA